MRLSALTLLTGFALTLPGFALAQSSAGSRAVHDTFKPDREAHLAASDATREKYHDDGTLIMKQRAAEADDMDHDRAARRTATQETAEQWKSDWTNAKADRESQQTRTNIDRKTHQRLLSGRPGQWWGQTDDFNQ